MGALAVSPRTAKAGASNLSTSNFFCRGDARRFLRKPRNVLFNKAWRFCSLEIRAVTVDTTRTEPVLPHATAPICIVSEGPWAPDSAYHTHIFATDGTGKVSN